MEVGIGNGKIYIGVRHFPDRKKPSFVVERGNQAVVLGSFINEHAVEEFEKGLKELLGGWRVMNKIIKTQEEMIQELAIMYATSLVRYGVDIQGKLESATQISMALNEAYCRGREDEREYMTRSWQSEVAENE